MNEELLRAATTPSGDGGSGPRSLLVFAHPDDETVALGARLHRLNIARIVHVTDGAPRDERDSRAHGFSTLREYREARAAELRSALAAAGIEQFRCENLAIPDQRASLHLAALARRIARIIRAYSPEVVFTHPYEGGHPDHDACAFAVQHAARISGAPAPLVIECAFYHMGHSGIETGMFLPHPQQASVMTFSLSADEQRRRKLLLDCFTTQRETLRFFPADRESFRVAPAYDFTQPPHAAKLFYEQYPWGMTGERFRDLAARAERELAGTAPGPCL